VCLSFRTTLDREGTRALTLADRAAGVSYTAATSARKPDGL